jgi:hypothetical protein
LNDATIVKQFHLWGRKNKIQTSTVKIAVVKSREFGGTPFRRTIPSQAYFTLQVLFEGVTTIEKAEFLH